MFSSNFNDSLILCNLQSIWFSNYVLASKMLCYTLRISQFPFLPAALKKSEFNLCFIRWISLICSLKIDLYFLSHLPDLNFYSTFNMKALNILKSFLQRQTSCFSPHFLYTFLDELYCICGLVLDFLFFTVVSHF